MPCSRTKLVADLLFDRILSFQNSDLTVSPGAHEKNIAESRYDTRISFSRKLTRTSFSYKFLVRLSIGYPLHISAMRDIDHIEHVQV